MDKIFLVGMDENDDDEVAVVGKLASVCPSINFLSRLDDVRKSIFEQVRVFFFAFGEPR
jgi:hypothetical protein